MFAFNLIKTPPHVHYMGTAWEKEEQDEQHKFLMELIENLVGNTEIIVTSELIVKIPVNDPARTTESKKEIEAKKITIEFQSPTWRD